MPYHDFTRFAVWQEGFQLLQEIYQLCALMPHEEKFVLNQDLRRSANSVVHNIAEGYGRYAARDKTRFYKISRGSAYEAISQLYVAGSQRYCSEEHIIALTSGYKSCISQLDKLIKTLETRC